MAVTDILEMLDTFLPSDEDDDSPKRKNDNHLTLWKRANLVVKVLMREKRKDDAMKVIVSFFRNFEDLDMLEEAVTKAEDLVTKEAEDSNEALEL